MNFHDWWLGRKLEGGWTLSERAFARKVWNAAIGSASTAVDHAEYDGTRNALEANCNAMTAVERLISR